MHSGARACMLRHSSPHLITAIPVSARCHWLSCHSVSVMSCLEDPRSLGSGDGGGGAEEQGRASLCAHPTVSGLRGAPLSCLEY